MKKLLFICTALLLFVSCSPDEPAQPAKKRYMEKVVVKKLPYWNPATQASWDYEEPDQYFPEHDPDLYIVINPKNEAGNFWLVDIDSDVTQFPKTFEMITEFSNTEWEFNLYDDDSNQDKKWLQPMNSWAFNPSTSSNPIVLSDGSEYLIEIYYLEK
ncbi:MAG: hypothetical protein ACXWDO_06680 [Bacteroidia bacterium]